MKLEESLYLNFEVHIAVSVESLITQYNQALKPTTWAANHKPIYKLNFHNAWRMILTLAQIQWNNKEGNNG